MAKPAPWNQAGTPRSSALVIRMALRAHGKSSGLSACNAPVRRRAVRTSAAAAAHMGAAIEVPDMAVCRRSLMSEGDGGMSLDLAAKTPKG